MSVTKITERISFISFNEGVLNVPRMGPVIKGGAIMRVVRSKLGMVENMGFYDRVIRALVGLAMNVPIIIYLADLPRSPVSPFEPYGPQFFVSVGAFYFLLTALLGWDRFFSLFMFKSC